MVLNWNFLEGLSIQTENPSIEVGRHIFWGKTFNARLVYSALKRNSLTLKMCTDFHSWEVPFPFKTLYVKEKVSMNVHLILTNATLTACKHASIKSRSYYKNNKDIPKWKFYRQELTCHFLTSDLSLSVVMSMPWKLVRQFFPWTSSQISLNFLNATSSF